MFRRQLKMLVFAASLAGMTGIMSAGAESPSASDAGINLSEWGREAVLSEWSASAEIRGAESNPPGLDDFLFGEIRTFATGATDPERLRQAMANRAVGREDDSALSWMASRWESAPDRLADFAAGRAETWLESASWVESAQVDWSPSGGDWAKFSASGVGILHGSDSAALGILPRVERAEEKLLGSFGVFHRRAFGEWGVGGVNLVADYADDAASGEFTRWSMGADFRSAWADAYVNRYFGGDSVRQFSFADRREVAYSPDGLDAEFRLHAPGREWLGGFARFSKWDGRFGQGAELERAYGISFAPGRGVWSGLRAEASAGDSAQVEFKYERILGAEAAPAAAAPFAAGRALVAPVERNNEVVIRRQSIASAPPAPPLPPFLVGGQARQFVTDDSVPSYLRDAYDDCQYAGEISDWIANTGPDGLASASDSELAMSVFAAASSDTNFINLCWALRFQGNPNYRSGANSTPLLGRNSTPLHKAAMGGALKNVKLLILAGADPRLTDDNGKTPLDLASHIYGLLPQSTLEYCASATGSNTKDNLCEIGRILVANGGECNNTTSRGVLCGIDDGNYRPLKHPIAEAANFIPQGGVLTVTMHSELQGYSADDNFLGINSPFYSATHSPIAVLPNLVDAESFSEKTGINLTTAFAPVPYSGGVRIKYHFSKPPLIRVSQNGFVSPYTYSEQEQNHGGRTPLAGMGAIVVTGNIEYSAIGLSGRVITRPSTIVVKVVDPKINPPTVLPSIPNTHVGVFLRVLAIMRAGEVRFELVQTGTLFALSVSGKDAIVSIPEIIPVGDYTATLRAWFSRDGTALNTDEFAFTVMVVEATPPPISSEDMNWPLTLRVPFVAPGYSGALFSVTATTPVSNLEYSVSAPEELGASVLPIGDGVGVVQVASARGPVDAAGEVRAVLGHGFSALDTLTAHFTATVLAPISTIYYARPDFTGVLFTLSVNGPGSAAFQLEGGNLLQKIRVNSRGEIRLQLTVDIGEELSYVVNITSPEMLGTIRAAIRVSGKCVVPSNIDGIREDVIATGRYYTLGRQAYNAADDATPNTLCNLLRQGADPDYRQSRGTPIFRTIFTGYAGRHINASILLDFGANPNYYRSGNSYYPTPLLRAAGSYSYEVARILIERGALIGAGNYDWHNPLHLFAKSNPSPRYPSAIRNIAQLLIDRGADVDARDKRNRTAVYLSITPGTSLEILDTLLDNRANPNIPENRDYCHTPLHEAVRANNLREVRALLVSPVSLYVNPTTKKISSGYSYWSNGTTPLDMVRAGSAGREIKEDLLDAGACYGTSQGKTPQCTFPNFHYRTVTYSSGHTQRFFNCPRYGWPSQ